MVLDALINIGLFIFATNNNRRMLEYVIENPTFPEGIYSVNVIYCHETGKHYNKN